MYKLARHYVIVTQALIAVTLLQTSYFSILVTQSMPEGATLPIVWWYLWVLVAAFGIFRYVAYNRICACERAGFKGTGYLSARTLLREAEAAAYCLHMGRNEGDGLSVCAV